MIARTIDRDPLLDLFYDQPFVGMAVISPTNGRWLRVNDCVCQVLGYSREELVTLTLEELTHPDDRAAELAQIHRMLAGEVDAYQLRQRFLRKDGTLIETSLHVKAARNQDGGVAFFVATIKDITEQKLAEQREYIRIRVLEQVARGAALPEILDALVRGTEAENAGMLGSILLLDEEGRHVLHGAAPSLPDEYTRRIHGEAIGPVAGSCGTAAFRGERVIVSDIGSDPLWADYRGLALQYGLQACWSQPILSRNGKVLGTFAMYYREVRSPGDRELKTIVDAANIAAIAIEHEYAREALKRAYERLAGEGDRLKQTLEALEQSEKKYRTLFESSSDALMLFDGKVFLDCNVATLRIFGCESRDQFLGTHPGDWSPALQPSGTDSRELARAYVDTTIWKGNSRFEWVHKRLDGSEFPTEVWLTAFELRGKTMLQATVRDISERKRAELELRDSEARIRSLFDQAADGIFLLTPDHRYLDANAEGLRMLGYSRDELLRLHISDVLAEHERHRLNPGVAKMMAGTPHLEEWEHLRKDGSTFPAEVSARAHSPDQYLAIVRDLTARKKAEKALREGSLRLELAVQAGNVGLWDWNLGTNEVFFSREWKHQLGYEDDEIANDYAEWETRLHPDDRVRALETLRSFREKPETGYRVEFRLRHKDGSYRWILAQGALLTDETGRPVRMLGSHLEITARKEAEQALHASQQRLRKVIDGLGPNTFAGLTTPEGILIEANRPALAAAGLTPEDVLGKLVWDTYWWSFSKSSQQRFQHAVRRAAAGESCRYDVQVRVAEGQMIDIDFSIQPMFDDAGKVEYLVPSANVITERKRAEAELLRLNAELEQRVVARTAELQSLNRELETFAYAVSHDLKAPLRGIDGYSRLLLEDCAGQLDEEGRTFVNNIRRGAVEMSTLIDDMLAYSRMERRTMQAAPVDLRALIGSVLLESRADLEAGGVELSVDLPPLSARADRDGLAVVLRNLLENALKFSRGATPPVIRIGGKAEGGKAVIWIRDNGIGFDMKFHDRIFEIFQRLQRAEDYPGTGIGLALVRKAMQRMGGRVWAESEPKQGATFFLELPL